MGKCSRKENRYRLAFSEGGPVAVGGPLEDGPLWVRLTDPDRIAHSLSDSPFLSEKEREERTAAGHHVASAALTATREHSEDAAVRSPDPRAAENVGDTNDDEGDGPGEEADADNADEGSGLVLPEERSAGSTEQETTPAGMDDVDDEDDTGHQDDNGDGRPQEAQHEEREASALMMGNVEENMNIITASSQEAVEALGATKGNLADAVAWICDLRDRERGREVEEERTVAGHHVASAALTATREHSEEAAVRSPDPRAAEKVGDTNDEEGDGPDGDNGHHEASAAETTASTAKAAGAEKQDTRTGDPGAWTSSSTTAMQIDAAVNDGEPGHTADRLSTTGADLTANEPRDGEAGPGQHQGRRKRQYLTGSQKRNAKRARAQALTKKQVDQER